MKNNHNLYVLVNIICLIVFFVIPFYTLLFKDYQTTAKIFIIIACGLVEWYLIDELREEIKENNKPF
jgi:K+-sensing histidine kinase KdpD